MFLKRAMVAFALATVVSSGLVTAIAAPVRPTTSTSLKTSGANGFMCFLSGAITVVGALTLDPMAVAGGLFGASQECAN